MWLWRMYTTASEYQSTTGLLEKNWKVCLRMTVMRTFKSHDGFATMKLFVRRVFVVKIAHAS